MSLYTAFMLDNSSFIVEIDDEEDEPGTGLTWAPDVDMLRALDGSWVARDLIVSLQPYADDPPDVPARKGWFGR